MAGARPALDVQVGQVARRSRASRSGTPGGLSRSRATPPRHASARSSSSRALARVAAPPALAAEHLGELDDAALAVEVLDLGDGPAVALALGDPVVGVGMGRDLRQVGDAQHLVATREGPQAAPDRVGAPPADPGVDLVEDEDGRVVGLGEDALDRQRDARQLAARGDPGERPGRLAGVRGEAVDDLVGAAGIERDRVAVELDRGLVRARRAPPERDLEHAGREAELDQHLADGRRQGVPAGSAGGGQPRGRAATSASSARVLAPRVGRARRRGRASRSSSAAARSPWAMTSASPSP